MITKYSEAKHKAETLIEQFALTTPVQIFQLADMLGIKWKTYTTDELSSFITKKEHEFAKSTPDYQWDDILGYFDKTENVMLINTSNQPITRKRFTMAHEIGHHQLHHEGNHFRNVFFRQDIVQPRSDIEAEANYFAGYLLMPDKEIEKKLPYTDLMLGGEVTINEFAKMFAVSPDAMRIRLRTYKQEHPAIWEQYKMEDKLF